MGKTSVCDGEFSSCPMKTSLQLKFSQHLALTPQLQQSIRLLQLSTLELDQELERYLLENPLLEREEEDGDSAPNASEQQQTGLDTPTPAINEVSSQETSTDYDNHDDLNNRELDFHSVSEMPSADDDDDRWSSQPGSGVSNTDEDNDEAHDLHAATPSLREHLFWQLGLSQFSDHDKALIACLIEALNEDGYLELALEEVLAKAVDLGADFAAFAVTELSAELGHEGDEPTTLGLAEFEVALKQLQSFDPLGVAARSLQECLQLQLRHLPASNTQQLAIRIVADHLDLLAAKDFTRLKRLTACDDTALREAQAMIVALNPRPGARFAQVEARYITPDVIVRKIRGKWQAQINPDAYPRLRINRLYAEILQQQRRGDNALTGQLQEARWLIKNVQQRFDTILRVAQEIVDRQAQFFEHGEVAMRPLVLREIADALELHESTISRVTSQKYMATARGVFELKYFFGSHVATESGGACSATAIRALIKQLIANEDGKKPLSDSQISEILGRQGIVVARRTVAKYRESLNIPPVNLRKTL